MLLRFLRLKFRKKTQRWIVLITLGLLIFALWWVNICYDSYLESMRMAADRRFTFPTIHRAKTYKDPDIKSFNLWNVRGSTTLKQRNHWIDKSNRTYHRITKHLQDVIPAFEGDGRNKMSMNDLNRTKPDGVVSPRVKIIQTLKIPSTQDIKNFMIMYKNKRNRSSNHIPTIIHQIWENETIPVIFSKWIKSWRKMKHFEYWFWTEHSIKLLLQKLYPDFIDLYNSYEDHRNGKSDKADARRYFILYAFGGYYADLDFELLKPFKKLTNQWSCFIGEEPLEHVAMYTDWTNYPTNAIMGCIPGHPFFKHILSKLPQYAEKAKKPDSAFLAAGPKFISFMYHEFKSTNHSDKHNVVLAPAKYFMPTFDKDIMSNLYHFCTEAKRNRFQNEVCNELKARSFSNNIPNTAYTNHLWEHSYKKKYLRMMNIRDANPYVINTSELFI